MPPSLASPRAWIRSMPSINARIRVTPACVAMRIYALHSEDIHACTDARPLNPRTILYFLHGEQIILRVPMTLLLGHQEQRHKISDRPAGCRCRAPGYINCRSQEEPHYCFRPGNVFGEFEIGLMGFSAPTETRAILVASRISASQVHPWDQKLTYSKQAKANGSDLSPYGCLRPLRPSPTRRHRW
jgi:hypothetical protein